jgi:hypothetical protein
MLLPMLSRKGRADVVYRVLQQPAAVGLINRVWLLTLPVLGWCQLAI